MKKESWDSSAQWNRLGYREDMDKEGTTETPQVHTRQYSRGWKTWDVFVFVVLIAGVILFPLGGFDYICGRLNFMPYWLFRWCCYPIIGCSIVLCLSIALCLRTKAFNALINRALTNRGAKALIVPIALVGLVVFLWIVPGLRGPFYMSYMQGFRDRIESNADIEDLRIWLRTLREEDYSDENFIALESRFRESLSVLRWTGYISAGENGSPEIRLVWGSSSSGVWGVVIGMEDTETPRSDYSEGGEYILAVEPGVYVWRQLPGR
jgi:hypothetical protein